MCEKPDNKLLDKKTREIELKPWEEVIGKFVKLSVEDHKITVYLDVNKRIRKLSCLCESEDCIFSLTTLLAGQKVGILRTDDSIIVRVLGGLVKENGELQHEDEPIEGF